MATGAHGSAEHLIVGGGVIGLTVAYELLRRGRSVRVVERAEPGAGATGVAGGMLAPVSEADCDPEELVRFGQESLRRYPAFIEELERRSGKRCSLRTDGTLWVALDRDDCEELDHLRETLEGKSLAVERLSAAEVLAAEPHLSPRVTGGLRVAGDHQVDPRALVAALAAAIAAMGGQITRGTNVERLGDDGSVRVRDAGGAVFEISAERVVLAAGAWSDTIEIPGGALGVRPVKGQLLRLRGPQLVRCVLRTPDLYVVPRGDGELLVGASVEEMGFDDAPTAGATLDLLRHTFELLPGVYDLELRELTVGFRPALADHLPAIGPVGEGKVFLALGHFRHGILLAPATGHYLAEWLCTGEAQAALRSFSPRRFATETTTAAADEG